jgi:hypothetical protein
MAESMTVFPFRPGDWVSDQSGNVAKVKGVWEGKPGEVLIDLVLYNRSGERIGRDSPAMGGPRTFEPACDSTAWHRIKEPTFPIDLKWVQDGKGKKQARYFAGDPLPPAQWKKPKPRSRMAAFKSDDRLRRALEKIANGDNDARATASAALGRR